MKKNLQFFLFVCVIVFSSLQLKAQTVRTNSEVKNQKIEVTPTFETHPAENIPEKETVVRFQQSDKKTDSLLPVLQATPNMQSTKAGTKINYSTQRAQRINETSIEENAKVVNINESFFPDLKVEATQEQPYDNGFVSQEKSSQKLVKLERIPADDVQVTNANTNTQNRVTISPSKRKYLEGIAAELEKEIQSNPDNTSTDMQAKKKELEDLKKLLMQ